MEQTTVNIGQSRLNMQAAPLASSILEILPARGTRPNEKKINVDLFLKKVIQKSVRLIWSAEK